jgi:hypothetical protein
MDQNAAAIAIDDEERIPYPPARIFTAPIRIGRDQTGMLADEATTAAIADAVATTGGVVLHDVIAPDLLASWMRVVDATPFRHVDIGQSGQFGTRNNDMSAATALPFCMALARPVFMAWLERIGGCAAISHIEGHLAQMQPGHAVHWHRDAGLGIRRLALVLNLSTLPYEGGRFELRRKSTQEPLLSYYAHATGSLAIFRLGEDLQHRVLRLTSGGPRNIFAGWARGRAVEADARRAVSLTTWPPLVPDA